MDSEPFGSRLEYKKWMLSGCVSCVRLWRWESIEMRGLRLNQIDDRVLSPKTHLLDANASSNQDHIFDLVGVD